ncbi:MAG: patatin-like phospholipase family protein, partial [Sphaerospermopsis sp. SIO1G2]|nr:patatin-like phospholipase family protein [Sphaerospermopsis sp. SIO1G2]
MVVLTTAWVKENRARITNMTELVAMSLSGGASKGAFEAGAIYYICGKLKVDPRLWTGTSVGALNSLAALHMPMGRPQELAEVHPDPFDELSQ